MRVCSGGSFSMSWLRCSVLKGSICSAGCQSVQIRPSARCRRVALTAACVVATQRPSVARSMGPASRQVASSG